MCCKQLLRLVSIQGELGTYSQYHCCDHKQVSGTLMSKARVLLRSYSSCNMCLLCAARDGGAHGQRRDAGRASAAGRRPRPARRRLRHGSPGPDGHVRLLPVIDLPVKQRVSSTQHCWLAVLHSYDGLTQGQC